MKLYRSKRELHIRSKATVQTTVGKILNAAKLDNDVIKMFWLLITDSRMLPVQSHSKQLTGRQCTGSLPCAVTNQTVTVLLVR